MTVGTSLGVSMITGLFDSDPNSPMSIKKRAPFELRVGSFVNYELEVLSFRGKERVNDVYRYEVTFATSVDEDTLHLSLFAEPACLTIKAPGYDPRVIQGLAVSLEALGGVPGEQKTGRLRYRIEIVPKLWLMKQRCKNRVFQQKSAPQIAKLMLAEIGMKPSEFEWRAPETDFPPLPFVYQRSESDFDFFRRVLADAGIYFYFQHASALLASMASSASASVSLGGISVGVSAGASSQSGATTLLTFASRASDTPAVMPSGGAGAAASAGLSVGGSIGLGGISASVSADAEASDTIPFDDGMGASPDDDRIYEFGLKKLLRTKTIRMHERDVENAINWVAVQQAPEPSVPAGASGTPGGSASLDLGGISASVSLGNAPRGSVPFDLDTSSVAGTILSQERYQVDGTLPLGEDPACLEIPRMKLELARTRRRFVEAQGKSDCRRMAAGYRFTLGNHPIAALNAEYTIVSVDAEGTHPDYAKDAAHVYRNRFRCIPATYAPIPPRPKKRPKPGNELAQVVAYSDIAKVPWLESSPNGYVKVRFHWDIVDKSGTSTGLLEDGVDHPSGTQDQFAIWVPVLQPWAGAGYGTQLIPREGMEVLVGFLEDQGERPVILGCLYSQANAPPWPAQNDQQKVGIKSQTRAANGGWSEVSIDDRQGGEVLTIRAQGDLEETVNVDRTASIGGNRAAKVGASDTLVVTQALTLTVGGGRTEAITGADSLAVKGDLTDAVTGDRTETTGGDHTITTSGAKSESITGSSTVSVTGDADESVSGSFTLRIDGTASTVVGTGDADESVSGSFTLRIDGTASTVVGKEEAKDAYSDVYVYGNHTIASSGTLSIKSLGSIVLQCGGSIISITPDGIQVAAKSIAMAGQNRMYLAGAGPALTLSSTAELVGKTVTILSTGASLALDSNATLDGAAVKLGSGGLPSGGPDSVNPASPMKSYHVVAKDASGTPYANKNYSLLVDGGLTQGTTGSDGSINASISATAVLAHLTVWTGAYPEGPRSRWDLSLVDKLEPVDSIRGALDRLTNLGYYQGEVGDVLTDDGVVALQRFQGDNNLPLTGALDAATAAQLSQSHGH